MLDGKEARSLRTFPISPNTPMYVGYAGRAVKGEDSAGEASPALSKDGEALVVGSNYSSSRKGCPSRRGTSDPDTKFLSEWARYRPGLVICFRLKFQPKSTLLFPGFSPLRFRYLMGIRGNGGKGRRRRREGRGENRHVACYSHVSACARYSLVCTLLPLTLFRRASYDRDCFWGLGAPFKRPPLCQTMCR